MKRRNSAARLAAVASIILLSTGGRGRCADSATEWRSYGRDYSEQRYSPLQQIQTANVHRLGVAWHFEMRDARGVEATPLIVDGVMYVTSAWSVLYALDARSGSVRWIYDPRVVRAVGAKSCCDVVNRGVAYADGRIFLAALDGRLIALDAKRGVELWQTQTIDDVAQPYVITGAPRVAKNMVFIGNSGGDIGTRGYVGAYDARNGRRLWRFYTVPRDPKKPPDHAASDAVQSLMARTWSGEWWAQGGGGSVWDSITYDPQLDRVYIGVDNGAPWNQQFRSPAGGDNLFLSSIVALDRRTGRYLWHYQTTPGDTWDSGATQSLVLATLRIDGRARRVLLQAPKNGFFYVIDRNSGKLLSAGNIVPMAKADASPSGKPISWAYGVDLKTGRPLENRAARYLNGASVSVHPVGPGAHGWQPMAFSPQTGLAYIPVQDVAATFQTDPGYQPGPNLRASGLAVGGAIPQNAAIRAAIPGSMQARLIAWDPVAQQEVWRVPYDYAGNGGVLTTAGGLVFEGTSSGEFAAYDAATGTKLWQFDAQATAQGGPVSYSIDGEQYVAIAIGNGGSTFLAGALAVPPKKGTPSGRVISFKLNGATPYPRVNTALDPVPEPPLSNAPPATIASGAGKFAAYCAGCHGFGAISGFVTPDLRRSALLQSADAFRAVVENGSLLDRGMPKFGPGLSAEDAETIRAFLIGEARYIYDEQAHSHGTGAPASPVD